MIGFDTGFFVKFLEGNKDTLIIWEEIIRGKRGVVTCLTLFELERLSLKGKLQPDVVLVLLETIQEICEIVWLDNKNILSLGARLSYSLAIPAVDSLILAGFLNVRRQNHLYHGCRFNIV